MSTLAKYIFQRPTGLRVRIVRGKLTYTAFVPNTRPGTDQDRLNEAIRLRDAFLILAGPYVPPVRSNTGEACITETVKWVKYRPRYAFYVFVGRRCVPMMKRIYYGRKRTRAQALELAIRYRDSRRNDEARMTNGMEVHHV